MSLSLWNSLAPFYKLLRQNPVSSRIQKKEAATILSLLSKIPDKSSHLVCDLGCGRGHSLEFIPKSCHFSIAVDSSSRMLKYTKNSFPATFFIEADVCQLPFKNSQYDLILCIGILEYIKEMDSFSSELKGVLKPNGYLLITNSPKGMITYSRFLIGNRLYIRTKEEVIEKFQMKNFNLIDKMILPSQEQYLFKLE